MKGRLTRHTAGMSKTVRGSGDQSVRSAMGKERVARSGSEGVHSEFPMRTQPKYFQHLQSGGRGPWLLATGLLVVVCALFVASRSLQDRFGWMEWVRAFSEAAMVGALADWFAVVALFRHPLGQRWIPHTAILPRRKTEMGVTMGRFVQENFLTRDAVSPWIDRLDFAAVAADFLRRRPELIVSRLAGLVPRVMAAVDDTRVAGVVLEQIRVMSGRIPAAPLMGEVLDLLTRDGAHEPVLTQALELASEVVQGNRERIRAEIYREVPIPDLPLVETVRGLIANYVAERTVERLSATLKEMAGDSAHPMRGEFRSWLGGEMEKLKHSPAYLAKGEEIKARLLQDPALGEYATGLWKEVRARVLEDLSIENSRLQGIAAEFLQGVGDRLHGDSDLREVLNRSLSEFLFDFIEKNREAVGRVIAATVDRWDVGQLIAKVEEAVGDDLQFIRLNGTVVGGFAGLLLHGLEKLAWP